MPKAVVLPVTQGVSKGVIISEDTFGHLGSIHVPLCLKHPSSGLVLCKQTNAFLLIYFLMLASPLKFSHHYKIEWHLGRASIGRNETSWRWYNVFCFTSWHLEFLLMCFLSHLDNLCVHLDKLVIEMINIIFCPASVPIFWYFSFHVLHLCWSSCGCRGDPADW